MKQKIEFTGKNIGEIFALPCVIRIEKDRASNLPVVVLRSDDTDEEFAIACKRFGNILHSQLAAAEKRKERDYFRRRFLMRAHVGDCIVEQDDGSWRVEEGGAK